MTTRLNADELRELIRKATDSDLSDGARYFSETCADLTQCRHGETGEYDHRPDGQLIEWLWNNRGYILKMIEDYDVAVKAAFIEGLCTGPDGGQMDDMGEEAWRESDAYSALTGRIKQ